MKSKKVDFGLPKNVIWEESTYRDYYGKLFIEPLERGYGITVGNAIRRVLLSSIPGVAITAIKIDGVPHEFSTISGVKEDLVKIILNLKQVALKSPTENLPKTVRLKITGKEEILASDLFSGSNFVVLNPDLHIATLDKKIILNFELKVSAGFGYQPAAKQEQDKIGTIPIDALFSPITKSAYHVENTRVAQRVDYEKLILEVWTNGVLNPREAVNYAANILSRHFSLLENQQELSRPINGLKLPRRIYNILVSAGVETLGDFINLSQKGLEKIDGLGGKSLAEIKKVRDELDRPL